jgi:hypothetical protein
MTPAPTLTVAERNRLLQLREVLHMRQGRRPRPGPLGDVYGDLLREVEEKLAACAAAGEGHPGKGTMFDGSRAD